VSVHGKRPRDWERRISVALARSGIKPLTLDPEPEGAADWSVGATYRPITRRRDELVRFELGYSRDGSRAHPWWIYTLVRDTWAHRIPEGAARDRWIGESLLRDAEEWLALWSVEIGNPADALRPERQREMQVRLEQRPAVRPTTVLIDGTAYAAQELQVPDHRAVVADAPHLGIAAQVFLRRDDRDPIVLRTVTIEHPT
jgi:hypothetical protein